MEPIELDCQTPPFQPSSNNMCSQSALTLTHPLPTFSKHLERQQLLSKIESVISQIMMMKQKQQNLQQNVGDLRKLIEITGKESDQQIRYLLQNNNKLAKKAGNLSNALTYNYRNGSHMNNCALYWKEFM